MGSSIKLIRTCIQEDNYTYSCLAHLYKFLYICWDHCIHQYLNMSLYQGIVGNPLCSDICRSPTSLCTHGHRCLGFPHTHSHLHAQFCMV